MGGVRERRWGDREEIKPVGYSGFISLLERWCRMIQPVDLKPSADARLAV